VTKPGRAVAQAPGAEAQPTEGTLHFAVDAALLFQLGEELVTKHSVALAELIKNAYDADATRVTITFENIRARGGTITISDNGSGMSFDSIAHEWMRIATSVKTAVPVSARFQRMRTGAKGIGRFAARRLAGQLVMTSVAKAAEQMRRSREETVVHFKWDEFKPGTQVQDVPIRYRRRELPPSSGKSATGTELRLIGVRDAWDEEDFRGLMQNLTRLVAPPEPRTEDRHVARNGHRSRYADPGLDIRIEASDFPAQSGDVREQLLSGALAVLEGRLRSDGQATYVVKFRDVKKALPFAPATRFPNVGAARFRIHFFVYKKDYFAGLDLNVRDVAKRGREEGGVHLYVDRFRVAPYGDPGDDWLKLDEDRGRRLVKAPNDLARYAGGVERPMLLLPGNNQLFGRVLLSRQSNPDVRQTLNREGVIETRAFQELRQFVRKGVDYLTVAYAREYEAKRKGAKEKQGRSDDASSLLSKAREQFIAASAAMPAEQRAQILQAIDLARQTVETQREDFISELSMLRVLASTGIMLTVFEHELLGILNGLRESHRTLATMLQHLRTAERQRFSVELSRLDTWITSARHQGELLGLLIARESRTRRRRLVVRHFVETIASAFASYLRDYGITLTNEVPANLRTPPVFEAELSAILINLLTNAFKAVREQTIRRVAIQGVYRNGAVVLGVSDTGVGAAQDRWEDFFQPFVGESEPDPILGEGTGLGLKIVRDFVGVYGGTARFVEPHEPWRTRVEVSLPEEQN